MKKIFILFFLILMFSFSLFSDDYGWAASYEQGSSFFPMGWSEDGTLFAYGIFNYSISIATSSDIYISIINIVSDETVWEYSKGWQESLQGEGSDEPYPPSTAGGAWSEIASTVNPVLKKNKILYSEYSSLFPFPISNGDEINIKLESETDIKINVLAVSRNLGSKKITSITLNSPDDKLEIAGYLKNNAGNRMVVVLSSPSSSRWGYINFYITGCHLKAGFTKTK